jgi:hypothetical protein
MAPAIIHTLPRSHTYYSSFMTGRADASTISVRSVTVTLKPIVIRVPYVGRAMAKAIGHCPLILESQVRSQVSLYENRVFYAYLGFPVSLPFHQCSTLLFIYLKPGT